MSHDAQHTRIEAMLEALATAAGYTWEGCEACQGTGGERSLLGRLDPCATCQGAGKVLRVTGLMGL